MSDIMISIVLCAFLFFIRYSRNPLPHARYSLRLRAGRLAICNGRSNVSRPCDKLFEKTIAIGKDGKASFERLEQDPKTTANEGNGPGEHKEKNQPAKSVARIRSHFRPVFL